jgi:hypothetical protein
MAHRRIFPHPVSACGHKALMLTHVPKLSKPRKLREPLTVKTATPLNIFEQEYRFFQNK